MASKQSLAIILGAGPGTGAAIARACGKQGSAVALLARSIDSLKEVAKDVTEAGGKAFPVSCDVSSRESIDAAFSAIKDQYPNHLVTRAFFNATNPFIMKPFLELSDQDLKGGMDINVYGAFYFSQKVIPLMLESKQGGFLCFSGATAAMKGSAKFAAFAPSKFALRGLAQSLAREFGPKNIHVSHVVLDGLIDTARVQGMMGDEKQAGSRLQPDSIADTLMHLSNQPKDCWTHELDLRPSVETW